MTDRESTDEQTQAADDEARLSSGSSEVETLKAELEAARRRINDLAWALQGEKSEREEFKARLTRERERLIDLEKANAAATLMDAVDEMDRALKVAPPDDPLSKGVRLIRESIMGKLEKSGLSRMDVVGKPFNPNEHEAADMDITANPDDDQKVTEELRAGYRLKDRVVRPARVKVARYAKPADA